MTDTELERLLQIASAARISEVVEEVFSEYDVPDDLKTLYTRKNGFYAFESALEVYPWVNTDIGIHLKHVNTLLRERNKRYEQVVCFAQDLFGGQFAYIRNKIYRIDMETAEVKLHSHTLEDWADCILTDYNYETGWELCSEWQSLHGPLGNGNRLVPRTPFILGGQFELGNLSKVRTVDALAAYLNLQEHIGKLKDGVEVSIPRSVWPFFPD